MNPGHRKPSISARAGRRKTALQSDDTGCQQTHTRTQRHPSRHPARLIKLGHNRTCFVTQEYKHILSRFEHYQGNVDALQKHAIPIDERLVQYWRRDAGFEVAPTSILYNVSIIGFDDIPMADFFRVPVTVVRQQPYEVGNEAARLLFDQIQNSGAETRRSVIPCTLIERDSCKVRQAS